MSAQQEWSRTRRPLNMQQGTHHVKTSIKKAALRSATCLTFASLAIGFATSANAQDTKQPAPDNDASPSIISENVPVQSDGTIIVTGSRIRRDNFSTPGQVNIITRDDAVLAGTTSTADVLQSSSVTSGTSQINGSFLGYVSEGGPAASTVGLRGLSSSRTLVLLNGRRLAPAGVGPQLVAADLNVLPSAIISRIEVLREGASSVYGSDAIAGVINVITDPKVEGITFDAYTDQPVQHGGGGRTYRTSVAAGKVFDRGHITASFEYRERTGMRVGDRGIFSCPRDLYFDPTTGDEVGAVDPSTGQLMCFPYTTGGGSGIASGYGIYYSFNTGQQGRITYDENGNTRLVNGLFRVGPSPVQLRDHIISPVRTYTGYLDGSYELDMLGDAEIYTEALFTRRESHQDFSGQISINPSVLDPNIEIYGGSYDGTPLSAYGFPVSPFFPTALSDQGINYYTPFLLPTTMRTSSQRVDFLRWNGGLRGSLGLGDWRYDANFQYSHTKSRYAITQTTPERLSNALETVLAPAGTPDDLITYAQPYQAGAGNGYTCASNVDGSGNFISGSSCVPLNMYDVNILLNGNVPANVYNYLYRSDVGHTKFDQTTISLNVDGSLFEIPGGTVRAAFGYEHRRDKLNDTPSIDAQNANLYNYSSAQITKGSDTVDEIYGEIGIPFLSDQPFFKLLELDVSGRWTHYKSYGSDFTYHFNGQWAVNDWVRFRGNYGTSFRAPNLYEQFVADQTGFYGGDVDPCSAFGTAYSPGDTVYDNCLSVLQPILGNNAVNYIATSGPMVTTRGGAGLLKAETSRSWGGGVVFTVPTGPYDFSLAVDYWNVKVKGEVTTLGSLILRRCYEADDFPNNQYCDLVAPRRPAGDPQQGTLASFLNPYLNVSQQAASGIDFDVRFATDIAGGRFVARAEATRNIHQYYQLFAEDEKIDYNGTLGVQGFGAGPKWVGNLDLKYIFPGDKFTVRYGITYVGKQDSSSDGEGIVAPYLGAVNYDLVAEEYWEHGLSFQWKVEDLGQITMGVNNLFNAKPPIISSCPSSVCQYTRIGNRFNSSNYNLVGRSFFLNVTRTFK
ncbi:TonB-dependent receptor domain-containing protein [Novosphingobium mangrovi (ex Huang et al. 2023)]|uniref:TonB-dependent receptor n=1 Tax=Novosphingobium mangrovi (ex Huang et al. 2023) TaxID=2976432 RepID=A0ABT2I4E3_9SPHN|nr:TonB-dependent receptor [Novosphingobium mangrovi (ex Huang et al. 2023)]MCT2399676.1 TonB-dependent receptor [Novosphingobium mangrovi (ex Huang et al. 2023)]